MFQQLFRSVSFKKIVAVIISIQFIFSAAPIRTMASDTNLRPFPLKQDGGRLATVKQDLAKTGPYPFVVDYDSPLAEEKPVAGGKCAQLAWAYNRSIPNPLGFNISVDAVKAYYRHNPELIKMIEKAKDLDTTDALAREKMANDIKDFMKWHTKLPPDVLGEITKEYLALSERISRERGYSKTEFIPMAYRGSGVIEDFEGAIPWFSKSIGAQPGQGTTLLNKLGPEAIEPSVIEVIAGLFNKQIFNYRDIQIFFDFVGKMKDVSEYNQLKELSRKYGFIAEANSLEDESSPGLLHLRKLLQEIENKEPGIKAKYDWLARLEKSAGDVLDPMNFTTGIAVLEMVDADFSGTAFTSSMATGFDGSTYARIMKAKSKIIEGITSIFPSFKKRGESFKGYTRYVKINLGTGLGPGIVEGKFQPNIVTLFDRTGEGDWVFQEKSIGRKHMSLIPNEKIYASLLKGKFTKEQMEGNDKGEGGLAKYYGGWIASLKSKNTAKEKEFANKIKKEFNVDIEVLDRAMKDNWNSFEKPAGYKATFEEKQALYKALNVNEKEFFTLSSMIGSMNDISSSYDTAAYVLSSPEMADSPLLTDEGYKKLADVIVKVGDTMAEERFKVGDKGWRERRDVEFAVTKCLENDKSKFKVKLDHTYDLVTGKDLGSGWVKIVHLQNRPINPEKEIQDPYNIIFKRMKIDEDYVEENHISARYKGGLQGFGAKIGTVYVVDPNRSLAEQEEEIKLKIKNGEPQIALVEEMGPEHDAIVAAAGGAVVQKGNDTSHAYIFSLELRIPIVINAKVNSGEPLKSGDKIVIDALHGEIYPGDRGIPLVKDDLIIRVNMLPKTIVGFIASTLQTAMEIARVGGKAVLVRQEFILNNAIKIYPQAARTYDLMVARNNGEISDKDLTADDLADIKKFSDAKYKGDIEAIKKIITGFPSAQEFVAEQMHYAANQLGTIFPQDDEIRDYDNKEKEALLAGLVGAKAFLNYNDADPAYDSPLDGMRGSALMSHSHYKKSFFPLKRGVLRSIKDGYKNNAFFFVYLRTATELQVQLDDFEMLCNEEGIYPEHIVVMVENGGNAWIINDIADIMSDFVARHRKDGVKGWKISFGTNDLNNSLGGTSRDDKDFTGEVKIMHPALINVEPAQGKIEVVPGYSYGPKVKGQSFIITINDETAPVVLRTVEHVSAVVEERGGQKNLCGQGPTKANLKGDWKSARTYMGMLDAVGTQSVTYVSMVMLDFDTQASHTKIAAGTLKNAVAAAKLASVRGDAKNIVVAGDVVVVEQPEDILLMKKGKNKQKIVVMKNTWNRDELDNKGIPWDYLNYAGAILLDEKVKDANGILQDPAVKTRIKGTVSSDVAFKTGKDVTIDFSTETVYDGKLATYKEKPVLNKLRQPAAGLTPETRSIMRFSASDLFLREGDKSAAIDIHPLAFVMYKEDPASVPEDARAAIKALIGNQDPLVYLQSRISEYVAQKTQEAIKNGQTPVYTVFRLTRNQMRFLKGGEAIEKTKGKEGENFDDPRKRLQGGTRALSDFWQIFDLELAAVSQEKAKNPSLALQTSKMGTRVQEIIEMQLRVFKSFGITPENTDIGLELTTSADPIMVEDYIKQGIKFFSYKDKELAEALLAANLANPDIFAVEGKAQAVQQALPRPLAYVKSVVAENKDKGVWLGLTSEQMLADSRIKVTEQSTVSRDGGRTAEQKALVEVLKADRAVYEQGAFNFGNVINAVRALQKSEGAIVIGAETIFENAGSLAALKQAQNAGGALTIAVWAKDSQGVATLKALGIDANIGLQEALASIEGLKVSAKKVVLINSDLDLENIKDEYNLEDASMFFDKNRDLRSVNVASARTGATEKQINAVPLAFAKALAIIFDEGNVRAQVAKMVQAFKDKGLISEQDAMSLNQLTAQLSDIPLVTVSDAIATLQETYADTLNKI